MNRESNFDGVRKKLSLSMIKRTDELIEKKNQIDKVFFIIILLLALLTMSFTYIILNSEYYLFIFENNIKINYFNKFILFIAASSLVLIYVLSTWLKKLKNDYEKVNDGIVKALEKDICKCDSKCSCKDEYVKYLYDKKINIFSP